MENQNIYAAAYAASPTCAVAWLKLDAKQRIALITDALSDDLHAKDYGVSVVDAKADGQVILRFAVPVAANMRSSVLLDIESFLKAHIDSGLVVWLEPLGDKNSLRNLRGIEVKA